MTISPDRAVRQKLAVLVHDGDLGSRRHADGARLALPGETGLDAI